MFAKPTHRMIPFAVFLMLLLVAGCSETTDPADGSSDSVAQVDPGNGSFILKSVEVSLPEGGAIRLDLVGSDLVLDDDGTHVELTVAVRNTGERDLYGPVTLWLGPMEPATVMVANPDTSLPVASIMPMDGFIYNFEFGRGGILTPDELSAGKLWRFQTPAQESFSFGLRAEARVIIENSYITGVCFNDPNRNGVRDPGETPMGASEIIVTTPNGRRATVTVGPDGTYAFALPGAGLYNLEHMPLFDTFAPIAYSTPNPRQVLITVGVDGILNGFDGADFGIYTDIPIGPPFIQFTDAPIRSLQRAFWHFKGVEVDEHGHLSCSAGYSGCQGDHQFSLWTNGNFMESNPVQIDLTMVHHSEEMCAAYFESDQPFDLAPLRTQFLDAYGPGVLVLNVIDQIGRASCRKRV